LESLKKFLNYKTVAIAILVIVYVWCNLPAAGVFEDTYYQYTSGGLSVPDGGSGFVNRFNSIAPLDHYKGTMNLILRPISPYLFDIRILGFLYFVILLTCFIILLKTIKFKYDWQNWLFSLFTLFVFADFAYLLRLNSPNVEPAFLVSAIALITISLTQARNRATITKSLLFSLIVLFMCGLKGGYAFLAPFLMLIPLGWGYVRTDNLFKTINLALLIVVAVSSIYLFGGGVSEEMKQNDMQSAIIDAANPSQSYVPENPTYPLIIDNYIKNPARLIDNLKSAAHSAYEIRPRYLSNYPNQVGLKEGFTGYSNIKRRLIQPDLWFLAVFLAATLVFSVFNLKREKIFSDKANYWTLISLTIIAFVSFVAPVIISGLVNLEQNLFFYNVFFDIILIYVVIGGVAVAANRRDKLKSKYGIKQ